MLLNSGNSATFYIRYEGEALENHEMDVKELAPALISIADLLEEANEIVNGGTSKIHVNVRGSFKSGSFGIDFSVVQTFLDNALVFLASDPVTAAANLITVIGFAQGKEIGLINFLKLLKNRPIERAKKIDNKRVRIEITHKETIDVDQRVLDLYKSARVRKALEDAIAAPLERKGVDKVTTSSEEFTNDDIAVNVNKEEREYFEMPNLEDEILGETTTTAYLQVVNLVFKENNKWRFSRGETEFYASVLDEDFLKRINRDEIQFSKNDILKVELHIKDVLKDSGIKTEYVVLKVLEHRSAARQLPLPIEDSEDED